MIAHHLLVTILVIFIMFIPYVLAGLYLPYEKRQREYALRNINQK